MQEIELSKGNQISITTDPAYEEHVTADMIYVDYQKFNEVLEPGDHVLIDDGEIRLSTREVGKFNSH